MEQTKQKPLLQHLSEFEQVLADYKPSAKTIALLQNMPLVLLVGPTAAGRNTLIGLLVQTNRYHSIVSKTTRQPRKNNGIMERSGVEYWFESEETVLEELRRGEFVEAAIIHKQQVSGTHIDQVEEASKAGQIAVNEVQIDGATHIHEYKPDTLCVFLLPPAFDKWMERIRARGDMDEAELCRRLESALREISTALKAGYYQFVINYEIHEATQAVDELANGREINPEKQQLGRDHAEQLLIDIQLYLESK